MKLLKKFLSDNYLNARESNDANVRCLLEINPRARFLDLGCDDGFLTKKLAQKIGTKDIYGVEIVKRKIEIAKKKGIVVENFDLNKQLPFKTNFFDVISANQVIEHLCDIDNFLSEINRVLKKSGYAIISTENASSWCNIFASILGWQIFSLTNFSSKQLGIGNPLALHKGKEKRGESWSHVRVLNFYGLRDFFELFGFKIEKIMGAGYFPLPSFFGNIDKIHSHFLTFKIKKIKNV